MTRDGIRLFYRSIGQGQIPLVIPAGFYLEDALRPLAAHHRLIFYDPRCRGRSECGDRAAVSLEWQIEDLESLRRGLGIESMALLGWSGLGMEMAQYTIRYPERVTRLIQVGAVPPSKAIMDAAGDRRSERIDAAAMSALQARMDAGEFEEKPAELCRLYKAVTGPASFADRALADKVPDVCVYENEWPKNLWPYFGALLGSFGEWDLTEKLGALSVPRLVIHGREDGIPLAGAEAWASAGDSRLLVLSSAGHYPFLERPDEFFAAVKTFLAGDWPEGAVSRAMEVS